MKEETKAKLNEWAGKLGRPIAELEQEFANVLAMFKTNVPGKDEAWYEDAARHRIFLEIKSDLQSPSRPFDVLWLGSSAAIDVSAQEMEEKRMLWANPQTREQAVAEGKVYRHDPTKGSRMTIREDDKVIEVPDGTPLDTRVYMILPDESKGTKGRKNNNFGKPLQTAFMRNHIGFGRPATGGGLTVITLGAMANKKDSERLTMTPPRGKTVRTRMNVRNESKVRTDCNWSVKTRFDQPVSMAEIPDEKVILSLLETCPLRIPLADFPAWHKTNEKDNRRVCVLEGDVSFVSDEPTRFGSYIVVLEDTSREDLEAPGTTVFTNEEPNFGRGSRVFAIGRSSIGPGRNPDTGEWDESIEKVNLNASGIFVDPERRVPPEEESVIEAEPVK